MKALLNSKYFYVLFPIWLPLGLVLFFFNVPAGFYPSLLTLLFIVTGIFIVSAIFFPGGILVDRSYAAIMAGKRHRQFVWLLCAAIILLGPFDVLVNGFKLANPLTYAEFHGIGRYIRHVSSLCWALVPIAFIYCKSRKLRLALIVYAIVFPILIVDRNRLFMSFFSLVFCIALAPPDADAAPRAKRKGRYNTLIIFLVLATIFSLLGVYRSGDSFIVESSGKVLASGSFPLRALFFELPVLMQQIVLYIAVPTFNFATMLFMGFRNKEFLQSQFSPFSRDDAYQFAPVMMERFNVGTEFYPWLLYGGVPYVVFSVTVLVLSFFLAVRLLRHFPNVFSLLIFLKISYSVLFMGFAPQFFILLNLIFIVLMAALWTCSSVLQKLTTSNNIEFSGKLT